ncbi:hypothetical protein [[Clostridium] fimetarium]|uniref:Uncharacterized protein n=1 Tax=[Clostridium] fimetarium TaxID=99656 RepID=A0A1I0PDV3_9FIRM|nr:hypothetical protein [[Clostridium] fimetarium]SEW12600.1 hypothetical protein SAMN05421659_10518 [[Clostridium] fimetarium]
MKRELKCLRCDQQMEYMKSEKIQLGQTGYFWGNLSNLTAGALEVDIYICNTCGKIEFFQAEEQEDIDHIAQRVCPRCGKLHDMDYPKCPFCKYNFLVDEQL